MVQWYVVLLYSVLFCSVLYIIHGTVWFYQYGGLSLVPEINGTEYLWI